MHQTQIPHHSLHFQEMMPFVTCPPTGIFDQIHKFRIDFPFAGDYNNRLCPSAMCRAPSERSETLVWQSIITDSFHRGHLSLPAATHVINLYPFKGSFECCRPCLPFSSTRGVTTPVWSVCSCLFVHLILGDLQRRGEED